MTNLIYTSYFGKAKNFDPEKFALIGIARTSPKGWNGLEYKKLAPSFSILDQFKKSMELASNESGEYRVEEECVACDKYSERFQDEILKKLNPQEVLEDLRKMSYMKTPVLLCYEKSRAFCHRHIVASWLLKYSEDMLDNDAGYDNDLIVREYDFSEKTPDIAEGLELGEYLDPSAPTSKLNGLVQRGVSEMVDIYAEATVNGTYAENLKNMVEKHIDTMKEILAPI